jgi:hypothetical protein
MQIAAFTISLRMKNVHRSALIVNYYGFQKANAPVTEKEIIFSIKNIFDYVTALL